MFPLIFPAELAEPENLTIKASAPLTLTVDGVLYPSVRLKTETLLNLSTYQTVTLTLKNTGTVPFEASAWAVSYGFGGVSGYGTDGKKQYRLCRSSTG